MLGKIIQDRFVLVKNIIIHLSLHVLFLFSLYAHASYQLYAIFYISVSQ